MAINEDKPTKNFKALSNKHYNCRRIADKLRKKIAYDLRKTAEDKRMMLQSFMEHGNLYDSTTRLTEMSSFPSPGARSFTTFPNYRKHPAVEKGYKTTTSVMGCVPLFLMASLLNEIKPRKKFDRIIELAQEIGRRPGEDQTIFERGYYFMLHWQKSKVRGTKWDEEMLVDWKLMNDVHNIFSPLAVAQIHTFGFSILKSLGFHPTKDTHSLGPGIVYTDAAYAQAAHTDFDECECEASKKSWILHMPLQKEGMLLSVWDYDHLHNYVFIPFGSYLAIRSDVMHSGVYGEAGNCRFHLILKCRNSKSSTGSNKKESLHFLHDDIDSTRSPWPPVFKSERRNYQDYSNAYTQQLHLHTGGAVTNSSHDLLRSIKLNSKVIP
jgi:hypothetical protein